MKSKNLIIVYIIVLSAIVVGLIICLGLGVANKLNFHGLKKNSELVWQYSTIVDISKLNINVRNYDVILKESLDNKPVVEVYDSRNYKDNISISENKNLLEIKQVKRNFCIGLCVNDRKIVVYLPNNLIKNLSIKDISGDILIDININDVNVVLTTTSGDIKAKNINKVDIKTVSGDIDVRQINEGNISSTSGDIEILELNSGSISSVSGDATVRDSDSIDITTTSGDIELINVNKYVNAKSTSGEVKIRNLKMERNSKIITTSGDVDIKLGSEVNIDATTTSGDKKIKNYRGIYNLTIKTTSGDITVE